MKTPGIGVAILVLNDQGHLLMGQRGPESKRGRGQWSIPGGAVDFGETLFDAAKRELKEETNLDLFQTGNMFRGLSEAVFEKEHWITIYIRGRVEGAPKAMEPGKCAEWVFIPIVEIDYLDLFPPFQNYWQQSKEPT